MHERPTILIVDDEPTALASMLDALTRRFGGDGGERMQTLQLRDRASGAAETIPTRFLFVLIGALPHTDWLHSAVQRDAKGFIPTGHRVDPALCPLQRPPMNFETSVPGVFAVGDVRLDSMKRVASAVGEGAGAIQNVHQYLQEVKGQRELQARVAA